MRSSDYWENRWQALRGDSRYARSWPDSQARWLELRFIASQLQDLAPRSVLEIGCGPFTLAEDAEILNGALAKKFTYRGLDSSPSAIAEARHLYSGLRFEVCDIAAGVWGCPEQCIISRRTLQNLTEKERQIALPGALSAEHGILIECTQYGLNKLNELRSTHALSPLRAPEFNSYLTPSEETLILKRAARVGFADIYYLLTRGIRDLKEFNTQYHFRAASLARDYPISTVIGPLQGFIW